MNFPDIDHSELDRPEILQLLFHPRPEHGDARAGQDLLIPVERDTVIGARFHAAGKTDAAVLFFHGNGEIAADYDDLAPGYNRLGLNFLVVDYRGYGRSTGRPTVTAMMRDAHVVFKFVRDWLADNDFCGPLIVMGRSLGSASALELAVHYESLMDALIIESGFAYVEPLLRLLGIDLAAMGIKPKSGFDNLAKIRTFGKPTLVIHAEFDHIIPFSDGRALYDACSAGDKNILMIPGANHNDIFMRGLSEYMTAIKQLAEKCSNRSKDEKETS